MLRATVNKLLVTRNMLLVARNKQHDARNLLRWCKRGIILKLVPEPLSSSFDFV